MVLFLVQYSNTSRNGKSGAGSDNQIGSYRLSTFSYQVVLLQVVHLVELGGGAPGGQHHLNTQQNIQGPSLYWYR